MCQLNRNSVSIGINCQQRNFFCKHSVSKGLNTDERVKAQIKVCMHTLWCFLHFFLVIVYIMGPKVKKKKTNIVKNIIVSRNCFFAWTCSDLDWFDMNRIDINAFVKLSKNMTITIIIELPNKIHMAKLNFLDFFQLPVRST